MSDTVGKRGARVSTRTLNWLVGAGLALASSEAVATTRQTAEVCSEGFENIASLETDGWISENVSEPPGTTGWFQGNPFVFGAQAGPSDSYVAADFHNGGGSFPVISNWLITPQVTFTDGNTLGFSTRELDAIGDAANRLQVLMCIDGEGPNCTLVGPASGDTNGYVTMLLEVNSDEQAHGYPAAWTGFTITPAMGLRETGTGRIAFRYYTLTQNDGTWGTLIGIDSVTVSGNAPCAFGDADAIFASGFEL
jgi:hypothetical protein